MTLSNIPTQKYGFGAQFMALVQQHDRIARRFYPAEINLNINLNKT
jgi:hypothetical protein